MTSTGLGPTIGDRLSAVPRAAVTHAMLLRRVLAVMLTGLGVTLLIRGNPTQARTPVVVAGRDLTPGRVADAGDLRTVYREAGTVPAGTLHSSSEITGRIVAAPMHVGEIFTDLRVLGPRLTGAVTSDRDARIVPIHLADAGVADLLHAGDHVDVISSSDDNDASGREPTPDSGAPTRAHVLASNAVVILVSHAAATRNNTGRDRVVLLATGADQATVVAATSLHTGLTVVFHD